jgi:endonuclease/exonuclease/phosphatase family metal-dependent hydrolase
MHTQLLARVLTAWFCYVGGSAAAAGAPSIEWVRCPELLCPSPNEAVRSATTAPAHAERWLKLPEGRQASGHFSLLTYNIAGLPNFVSKSEPVRNIPMIGPLLRHYDIVLVQEDFSYHHLLTRAVRHHLHRSRPKRDLGLGDGLNRFSRFPFGTMIRHAWKDCHGQVLHQSDCLAKKGFSVATMALSRDLQLDVYNVHFDAGRSEGDHAARRRQVHQLAAMIASRSQERAVVVAGDTNMGSSSESILTELLERTGLKDVCRSLECGRELVDRVLFRSSDALALTPTAWQIDGRFIDAQGRDLSDHKAVGVDFRWMHR